MRRFPLFLSLAASAVIAGFGALEARAGSISLPNVLDPGLTTTVVNTPSVITAISNGNTYITPDGTLTFGAFTYSSTATGTATAWPATAVSVLPFGNGPDQGIAFTAGLIVTPNNTLDLAFTYTVTAAPGTLITDAFLGLTGSRNGNGIVRVDETLTSGTTTLGTLSAGFPGVPTATLSFAGVSTISISVNKDVVLFGGTTPDSFATLSIINQGYSAVPEPTSMALLGIGLSGLFTLRRFLKRTSVA